MKTVVVDTNVFLSFVTDRDQRQQAQAAGLFESAADGQVQLILPQIVLTEIVYVMANLYKRPDQDIAELLADLLTMPHLRVEDRVRWSLVLDLWPERIFGFADAVLAAVATAGRHDAVASFDRKFLRRLANLELAPYWD